MKKIKVGVSLIIVLALFLVPLVFAEDAKGNAISAASTALKCKTDFFIDVLNSMTINITSAENLTQYSTKLQDDLKQIEIIIAQNNSTLKTFIKTTYEPDLKSAREAVNNWRRDNKNLTKEQKTELKRNYAEIEKTFNGCQLTALKEMANKRIDEFNKHLTRYQNVTDKLLAKGVNVSAMQKVIDDARLQIIAPLQAEIANKTSEKDVKSALKKYCLYNGCRDGINYHLAQRFEIAKLDATSKFLKQDKNASRFGDKISRMENSGRAAEAFMKGIGNKAFNDGGKAVKFSVDSAYNSLKETKELYKAEKEKQKDENKKIEDKQEEKQKNGVKK
ncbi:MAG: hypothetical protein AABX07_00535 [Nanoarchaeota archaeon]